MQQHNNDEMASKHCDKTLIYAITEANETELSLLLRAFRLVQAAHHGITNTTDHDHPLQKSLENIRIWADWQACFSQQHGGVTAANTNQNYKSKQLDINAVNAVDGMKQTMKYISIVTLYHLMVECVAIQRRVVTGKPYGPYVNETNTLYDASALLTEANQAGVGEIRYVSYAAMDPIVAHSFFAYVKRNYRLVIADLNDTLLEVHRWKTIVIPDLIQHVLVRDNSQQQQM